MLQPRAFLQRVRTALEPATIGKLALGCASVGIVFISCLGCLGPVTLVLAPDALEESTPEQGTAVGTPKLSATRGDSSGFIRIPTWTPTRPGTPTSTPIPDDILTPAPEPASERVEAQVLRVVDGDTIRVRIDGEIHALRYIGIDSPELNEQGGAEARAANAELVADQIVYLERDVSDTDQYGRLLRYVYLTDGTLVNAELVRRGYARSVSYPPDVGKQWLLDDMEREAREAERGIWNPVPTPKPPTSSLLPPSATDMTTCVCPGREHSRDHPDQELRDQMRPPLLWQVRDARFSGRRELGDSARGNAQVTSYGCFGGRPVSFLDRLVIGEWS